MIKFNTSLLSVSHLVFEWFQTSTKIWYFILPFPCSFKVSIAVPTVIYRFSSAFQIVKTFPIENFLFLSATFFRKNGSLNVSPASIFFVKFIFLFRNFLRTFVFVIFMMKLTCLMGQQFFLLFGVGADWFMWVLVSFSFKILWKMELVWLLIWFVWDGGLRVMILVDRIFRCKFYSCWVEVCNKFWIDKWKTLWLKTVRNLSN